MRRLLFFTCFLALTALAFGQSAAWQFVSDSSEPIVGATSEIQHYARFKADPFELNREILAAPYERQSDVKYVVVVPYPDGTLKRFNLFVSPIQSPMVGAQTGVQTFSAQGVDDPAATARFDVGRNGFHGIIFTSRGEIFIDPAKQDDIVDYIVYYKVDCLRTLCFKCDTFTFSPTARPKGQFGGPLRPGSNRKEYRLALKGTGEYTAFYGGVANADAGSVTVVNRVNGVYEKDLAIRMIIVNLVNYPDPATDPYTNNSGGTMLGQNQTTCDAVPGNANYDVGHVFSTGGGGIAGLRVVGVTGQKARGVTGLPSPIGDAFSIDYVAHEMGHQYGANHTFNGTTGSCGGGNRSASHAYEPGSGSTIMAYAGICGAEDLQPHSDDYFHTDSQDAIEAWRNNAGSGGTAVNTGNNSPTVNAGADFTVPQDTPFRLTATANDADGDSLTYCWEQFDLGPATPPVNEASQPLFRSLSPAVSPTRWFPKQATVLANAFDQWENLPSVNRSMNFRCTVRDNRAGGGNWEWDATVVTVSGAPFSVTSPNTNVNWAGNSTQSVTWNVGGGSVAANVRILLSTDGGASYYNGTATVLVASTANDGSENVTVPNINATAARIIVEPIGNVFYDLSNVNFTITQQTVSTVDPDSYSVVQGSETIHDLQALRFSDDVRLAVGSDMPNAATTIIELHGIAPAMTVNRLSFILEHQSTDGTRFKNIELWNWSTLAWETVSTTTGTLTDSIVKVDITTNPNRFISAATREMRARAHLLSILPSSASARIVDRFDRTVWELAT